MLAWPSTLAEEDVLAPKLVEEPVERPRLVVLFVELAICIDADRSWIACGATFRPAMADPATIDSEAITAPSSFRLKNLRTPDAPDGSIEVAPTIASDL